EIGGLFAGESMFHHTRDASKVALVALVERLRGCSGKRLIDVQWSTSHLATLGVTEIPRSTYLERLPELIAQPPCLS
ncbi:MAG: leucyl/phenylalanyl-tRNA--protein transferase, partial [Actinomycetota bacterium]|nr:leucyl/phenylalanyl-tRNA--protein transferase [Actinomycetota bacterium]